MVTTFQHELAVARHEGVDMARLEADMRRRWDEIRRA
jgi:hypothetical protein